MFKRKGEDWQQFRDLTQIMENAGEKQTPKDFTAKVMARLSEGKETSRPLNIRHLFPTIMNFSFGDSVTRTECAFYFFLTGFFYLVMGFILILGLRLPAVLINSGWLSFQPAFGLILAAELALMGIAVYKNGDMSIRFVRAGTFLYAALIIINCLIGTFYIGFAAATFVIAVFSIAGLVFAVLLGLALDHYNPETIFSEVRG